MLALALVGCLAAVIVESSAQSVAASNRDVIMSFDIRAQSLQDALDEFGALTGISGFYRADSVAGRDSVAIQGRYTPDAVLRMLIEGTGLVVQYTAPDAFVLERNVRNQPSASARERSYYALVQQRVREVFCAKPQIAPADYRIAVTFRIDATGRIVQPLALDATSDSQRDSAILSALQQVQIGQPPDDPSRDFVMLILPRASSDGRDCAAH